jgi:hypothetical protein
MKPADLIVCESTAAITLHLRPLSAKGPCYSGGIDTPFLCRAERVNGWDTKIPVEVFDGGGGQSRLCGECKRIRAELAGGEP